MNGKYFKATVRPLVSVVIPTYNRAHTIARAVASAFSQENAVVEVIVIDDGSSDSTPAVIEKLQALHGPALRYYRQANAGASAARNAGIDLARGTFVQFLDSDDTLAPEKFRLQLEAYRTSPAPTLVLCYGWMEEDGTEKRIGQNLGDDPQFYIEKLCGREVHVIPTLAPLWRRDYLRPAHRWDPQLSLGDDLEFHIRCLAAADRIAFVPDPLFKVHDNAGDRLSDFSTDNYRLAALLKTRILVHDTLVSQERWTNACEANMALALRSMYTVYLQRMADSEVLQFEAAAQRMCGPSWRGRDLVLLATARRVAGPSIARAIFVQALFLRNQARRFTVTRMSNYVRRQINRLERVKLRDEIAASRTLREKALNYPESHTALYVELNDYHSEIIPGYVALLEAAGFRTNVLHRPRSEVAAAFSRMPEKSQPCLFPLTLRGMRRFLRSDAVQRYEVVVFGTGMLIEHGYFCDAFDFVGTVPNGRLGHAVIEHSAEFLIKRRDRLRSENLFTLRDLEFGVNHLPMLAPVEFGGVAPAPLSEPVVFAVVGRLNPNVRDVAGLFQAVRELMSVDGPAFEVNIIGESDLSHVPDDIRPVFRVLGRLPFDHMYDAIDRAHYLLALLDSNTPPHRNYLDNQTTGTRQLSLGFHTPMILDRAFVAAYDFDPTTLLAHCPGRLQDGLEAARRLDRVAYERMQHALGRKKTEIFDTSLANLQRYLATQGAHI